MIKISIDFKIYWNTIIKTFLFEGLWMVAVPEPTSKAQLFWL